LSAVLSVGCGRFDCGTMKVATESIYRGVPPVES